VQSKGIKGAKENGSKNGENQLDKVTILVRIKLLL
jgi:hypothetical protein